MSRTDSVIAERPPNDGREWEPQCARCGSSVDYQRCQNCDEDGFVGHDCGEDCCCCLDPEPNQVCDCCHGKTGWYVCCSSPEFCGAHPKPGRENYGRGEIEWYTLEKARK